MNKIKHYLVLLPFLVASLSPSSWAWRGGYGGGWHGGYGGGWHGGGWGRGVGIGLYVGGPYYGWDYPDYYANPYYYPPAPYPYAPATNYQADPALIPDNVGPADSAAAAPSAQISRQRAQLDYDYADGDISKAQYNAGIARLTRLAQQAQNPAPETMSAPVTSTPAPASNNGSARQGIRAITDLHMELSALLDQKLKDGDITRAQHDSEANYLNQIESQARNDTAGNGGHLTSEAEDGYVQQLHQAYYAINHNLITH